MINSELEKAIEGAWGVREEINPSTKGEKEDKKVCLTSTNSSDCAT